MSLAANANPFHHMWVRLVDFWLWLPKGTRLPEASWQARHRLLLVIAWAQVPFLTVIALQAGLDPLHTAGEMSLVISLILATSLARRKATKAVIMSVALVSCSGMLVHFTDGLIESHFHFFVVLPLISLYRDWRALATGIGFVVLHHSVVGVLDPGSVYNHPAAIASPVRWAFIHGTYILALTAVILTYWRLSEDLEQALQQEEARRLKAEEAKHRADTERLEHVVRSKDRFVASVSHELRTPLAAVLGFAEILRDQSGELSKEEHEELTSTIAREAFDIAGIVEDLLVAARAEIDAVHVSEVPVDLRANVAQVVEVLPDHHRGRLEVGSQGKGLRALADPVRVRQVVRNLVTNALRYGGPRVSVDFDRRNDQVLVAVSDNGPGIPEHEREMIFEPYHSAHAPGSQPSSVGLGLSVSRQLAELMGGGLTYTYQVGASTFELRLPAA
jgi:signal transduction histidine kinase